MAMMKAKRCSDFARSSTTIKPSVTPPMVLTRRSIWLMRISRSNAWAIRFEKALA